MTKEDPKPSHQLYSYKVNPHGQLGRLYACGIYKRSLRTPTKEKALLLVTVDIEGKNTQE